MNDLSFFKKTLKNQKDTKSSELALLASLFQKYSTATYWRVDLFVHNQVNTGQSSLILKQNLLPTDGACSVDKTNGSSLLTYFYVSCQNWKDPDGSIVNYEFFGMSHMEFYGILVYLPSL